MDILTVHRHRVKSLQDLEEKVEKEGGPQLASCLFSPLFSSSGILLLFLAPGWLFLQLQWHAEGLVDVGRKLLDLVVHQQVLREADREVLTGTRKD